MPASAQRSIEPPVQALASLSVDALRRRIASAAEWALVDVREEGARARDGHILQSVPLPFSHIELRAGALLPRLDVPLVVTDADGGPLAVRAARRLQDLGYRNVAVLDGGVAAWAAQGGSIYTGSNVFSKAFGEFVEHAYGTPRLPAREVKARLDRGDDLVVLDGRTLGEFETFHIPGAHAVPNAELPLRVHELVRSETTLVVVNCAGRTRSIIGAQALINAGLPNPVAALENGTMAWLFEGYGLVEGGQGALAIPGAAALAKARASAERLRSRFKFTEIDRDQLARFEAERETRALYVLDVRTRAEFEAGHLPHSRWAEGGQLVQATDRWVGIRNARIVLVDDGAGVRAAITASWLIQLGVGEVHVLTLDPASVDLEQGAEEPVLLARLPSVSLTTVEGLARLIAADAVVVLDVDTSLAYGRGHVPGARFAVRSRLPEGLETLPPRPLVVTSADGRLAALVAADLAAPGRQVGQQVSILEGGTAAWCAAGQPLETGATVLLHADDDVWRSPYEEKGDRHAAFQRYLDWEIALIDQIDKDETVSFVRYP